MSTRSEEDERANLVNTKSAILVNKNESISGPIRDGWIVMAIVLASPSMRVMQRNRK